MVVIHLLNFPGVELSKALSYHECVLCSMTQMLAASLWSMTQMFL